MHLRRHTHAQTHTRFNLAVLALTTALFVYAAPGALAQVEARGDLMIDRSFDFASGQALMVDVGDADLIVNTGQQQTATIRVYLAGRNMERAREYFDRQNFTVSDGSQGVSVRTRRERTRNWNWSRTGSPRITVVAQVPITANLDLSTSDGDVTLSDFEGNVALRTSDGDVSFASIRTSEVSLRTSDGDVSGDVIVANTVYIKTSDGDLQLGQVEAESVEAITTDGDIVVDALFGDAAIRTSDGDINVRHMEGRELSARTSDGDISIDQIVSGTAKVHTSDGSVSIARAEGSIEATTSDGDIRVGLTKPAAMNLRTSDGSVVLSLPEGLPANLELTGRSVRLASSLAFDGSLERRSAKGSLNGGGQLIRARASDGTVTVRPGDGR